MRRLAQGDWDIDRSPSGRGGTAGADYASGGWSHCCGEEDDYDGPPFVSDARLFGEVGETRTFEGMDVREELSEDGRVATLQALDAGHPRSIRIGLSLAGGFDNGAVVAGNRFEGPSVAATLRSEAADIVFGPNEATQVTLDVGRSVLPSHLVVSFVATFDDLRDPEVLRGAFYLVR